jgi:hypothetical protein
VLSGRVKKERERDVTRPLEAIEPAALDWNSPGTWTQIVEVAQTCRKRNLRVLGIVDRMIREALATWESCSVPPGTTGATCAHNGQCHSVRLRRRHLPTRTVRAQLQPWGPLRLRRRLRLGSLRCERHVRGAPLLASLRQRRAVR